MRAISLISMESETVDISTLLKSTFAKRGVEINLFRVPYVWRYNSRVLSELTSIVNRRKSAGDFVAFFPNSTELFLNSADFLILFSAYSRWFNPNKMYIIPHLWPPVPPPEDFTLLQWKQKPPLRIGFMGNTHPNSRLAMWAGQSPAHIKEWLLAGHYLKNPFIEPVLADCGISLKHLCTFARREALFALRSAAPEANLNLVERSIFGGTPSEKQEYITNMKSSTYVLCPRGTENFSYRVYEALCFGRVPVIIDTDMVFPRFLVEDHIILPVKYRDLSDIYDVIKSDHENLSEEEFLRRQLRAFKAMKDLRSMNWLDELATRILQGMQPSLNHLNRTLMP